MGLAYGQRFTSRLLLKDFSKMANSERTSPLLSVVIPVYNSEKILPLTIERTMAALDSDDIDFEIILVNDGSKDASWAICKEQATGKSPVRAFNLLRNYGQHTAMYCGLKASRGDLIVTMDDDLQNPPEEIKHLLVKASEGHDLVFGQFRKKQHGLYRRLGSKLVSLLNERLFGKPKDLVLSNFRLMTRDVVDRICSYRTSYPYLQGLALLHAANPCNTLVDHHPRHSGKSNYNIFKILALIVRILFSYSAYPLHFVSAIGVLVSLASFGFGCYSATKSLVIGVQVPGWTSVVVLTSFLNGVSLLLLSFVGEYVIRVLNQSSTDEGYHVKDRVD